MRGGGERDESKKRESRETMTPLEGEGERGAEAEGKVTHSPSDNVSCHCMNFKMNVFALSGTSLIWPPSRWGKSVLVSDFKSCNRDVLIS